MFGRLLRFLLIIRAAKMVAAPPAMTPPIGIHFDSVKNTSNPRVSMLAAGSASTFELKLKAVGVSVAVTTVPSLEAVGIMLGGDSVIVSVERFVLCTAVA